MTRNRIVVEASARTFVIRGWKAQELARDAGTKVVYSGAVNGWIGDAARLPDVVAYLEHRNIRFRLVGDEPTAAAAPETAGADSVLDEEVGLW